MTASISRLDVLRAAALARRYGDPFAPAAGLGSDEAVGSNARGARRLAEARDRARACLRSLLKLERDLDLARRIQQSTFPSHMPALSGYAIDAWCEPAEETGGDIYDVIGCRSARRGRAIVPSQGCADRAVLLMADATGHGIGPALSVAEARALFRMAVRVGKDLATIAFHLNEQLCADLPDGRFITAWLGELNTTDHTFASFSAGQAPILHYDAARDTVETLEADTAPLGVIVDLDISLADPLTMKPGDFIAVLSDGIFEASDRAGASLGIDRVVELVSAHRRASPARILRGLREAVIEFTGGRPPTDDRTAIVVKRLP